tara:strand:+ start:180 stop:932 length:753 start_codon:yes stop_codon:yes gene_type:complete
MFYSKKLKKFNEIKHCFFSRKGGYSKGLYKSLNCGKGSKDNKRNIIKNLSFVSKKMNINQKNLVLMYQTHSNKVIEINKNNLRKRIKSDAIISRLNNVALGVVTADCVPVLLFDFKNKIIGCIHAGWRGAFSNIIRNTVKKIKKIDSNCKIYAAVGPCIGKENYEVDLKFYKKFILKSKDYSRYFSNKSKNKKLFDLRKFVCDKLKELKVNCDNVNYDTFKEGNNFFSYRRSTILKQSDYGRCISIIRKL